MSTILQSKQMQFSASSQKAGNTKQNTNSISLFWEKAEAHRFAITPLLLVVIACMGGVAAAAVLQENVLKLALVAVSTALAEGFVLALAPMRTVLIASIISLVASILMIIL